MKFPNSKVFREALREYAIKEPVDIKFKQNEKKKISVYCINECGWRCYASQLPEELTFQIKTFNPECTCPRSFKHSQVTSSYVAKKFMHKFDKNPNWKVVAVQHHVKQALEIDISDNQVYRAKRKATGLISGDEQLPIIGLDGCHLKGRFGGQIPSAIARDANDNIIPVAFAVVEQENKDSWGLIPAIEMLFPTCEHRYCMKHIYNNFKIDHKGLELKDALWRCVGATTIREFERRMQEMKDLDVKAWEYLADINPAHI
nr:uncharacterized protein LOC111986249 [Quercus suber]